MKRFFPVAAVPGQLIGTGRTQAYSQIVLGSSRFRYEMAQEERTTKLTSCVMKG